MKSAGGELADTGLTARKSRTAGSVFRIIFVEFFTAFHPFGIGLIDAHDGSDRFEAIASNSGGADLHHKTWREPEAKIAWEEANFNAC